MDQANDKRPQFGNRILGNPADVFQHNAWDNVKWDETQEKQAREKVMRNSATFLEKELQDTYEKEASNYWDKFYGIHQNHFFKDRHWLFTEFPELAPDNSISPLTNETKSDASAKPPVCNSKQLQNKDSVHKDTNEKKGEDGNQLNSTLSNAEKKVKDKTVILEVGCGVGNTVFPILEANVCPDVFIYCCDFSTVAISIVQNNPAYDEKRCKAFVWDITNENADVPFPKSSLDIITLIFVLSAINPEKLPATIKTLSSYLRPGGIILFRDYGRYDMAELRFKPGHCLQDHFYVRGDGTRVYFFTQEELDDMFTKAGLQKVQNIVDRRLQVNRDVTNIQILFYSFLGSQCLPSCEKFRSGQQITSVMETNIA